LPQQFQQLLIDIFPFLLVGAVVWVIGCMAFTLWRRKIHGLHFPDRNDVNILFEERWTSGNSHKSLFTRMGIANNCLRVVVTDDELWVVPHFPFSAFAGLFDWDHRAHRDAITNVKQNGKKVLVTLELADGEERMMELRLRNADRFCQVLKSAVASGRNAG